MSVKSELKKAREKVGKFNHLHWLGISALILAGGLYFDVAPVASVGAVGVGWFGSLTWMDFPREY